MTNFEAITANPETLAAEITKTADEVAKACGRSLDTEQTMKEMTVWLRKQTVLSQK